MVLFLLALGKLSFSQELSNLRTKKVFLKSDTTQLDSLSIVPQSLSIKNIDSASYRVDEVKSQLIWLASVLPKDSVEITYRVFPISFDQTYAHLDLDKLQPENTSNYQPYRFIYDAGSNDIFNFSGLRKMGSISRGIGFGNNQDLSVNSNFNLNLSGKINSRINILASITDNNIPIQPEGNTQQLQDFDQIFIQLYDERSKLIVGDFQLKRPVSYFLNYYKRAQGATFSTSMDLGKATETKYLLEASAAVSKGKFARNIIQGVEGNQGPYRLNGSENEQFIIVLAGTERIFIDGRLLERGQEKDYIIDYNTAEVVFTANQLITKDKRIVAEFQYSDKNYARSILQFSNTLKKDNLTLGLYVYSEQDAKNQSLQQELTDFDKQLLGRVGDDLGSAVISGIDSIGYSNDFVLYQLKDSLGYDTVFVQSNNPDSAIYRLSFSNVGAENGNYIQDDFSANGKVYRWVAPDTIAGQVIRNGTFEPVILLVTPKKRQVVTITGTYDIGKKTKIFGEFAVSNQDLNMFSSLDRRDNTDGAYKAGIKHEISLQEAEKAWKLQLDGVYERTNTNFNPIERFRSVEFDRNWNIRNLDLTGPQDIVTVATSLTKGKSTNLNYGIQRFTVGKVYSGTKSNFGLNWNKPTTQINYQGSYLTSSEAKLTNFYRHKIAAKKKFKWITLGFADELEENQFSTDTLLSNSYQFYDWQVFLENPDTTKNKFKFFYRTRTDRAVNQNRLQISTFAENYGFEFGLLKNRKNILKGQLNYRRLEIQNDELTVQKPENTLLGRLEHKLKLWKGAVVTSTFYEIGSGLELRKEFVYLEVPAGQGIYVWIDYNADGVKDLNEFEIAAFPDQAQYIRSFIPSNEYVRTFTNQFSQSVNLRPAVAWSKKKGVQQFLSRFGNQTNFRIDRKTNSETPYNPFLTEVADSSLIALNASLRNNLYFNRISNVFGVDYTYLDNSNKTLLANGFDSRKRTDHEFRIRVNATQKITVVPQYNWGYRSSTSDFLSGRNFHIDHQTASSKISYQPEMNLRFSLLGELSDKKNQAAFGGESSEIRKLGIESQINQVGKGNLLFTFNYVDINYNGKTNSSLAFQMLDALQPGRNLTWETSIQRKVAKNLQLTFNYNGRKSEGNNAIHSGRVQARAFF